ncbi:molybdate ABC transporter substrate-binding protein [Roseomonas genomospecies 6]|uniref:Molybdate ABC transporter substrate-binding protein n=1 Tax=Roseomonas genomospecies 6 TaxID=214106 RepID=A0A9W7KP11_9PROT|nr:molybdate ABC transporter substrate-binding protein [Roseomonas genomospecies 6]
MGGPVLAYRTKRRAAVVAVALGMLFGGDAAATDAVKLYAAGSLKAALTELAKEYQSAKGVPVEATFGPSGLLKERLEKGESGDVFASANMEHPEALSMAGKSGPVRPFARNQLCALAQPDVNVTPATLLERLLDPTVRVGTSTPKADPAGDYAWELFRKADALRPGSLTALGGKALKLTGGPDSAKPPEGRNPYAWVMEQRQADLFLTYCTNARLAVVEVPALRIVAVPAELAVGAEYGLTVIKAAEPARGEAFADYILSPAGQTVLERYGFARP